MKGGLNMNDELEDLKKILDDDEEIKESYKPNKKRFVLIRTVISCLFMLLFGGAFLVVGILGVLSIISFADESGVQDISGAIAFIVIGGIPLLLIVMSIVGNIVRYKRTIYVVTNKRLIIRSGFIGVDYKAIEIKNIGLVNVRVDFLDKLVKPNTGTVTFASAALPMNGNNQQTQFTFACVDDPYEVYRVVKSYIG